MAWKATIYKVPRGLMAWGVRACTNTLATADNLRRWGHMVDPKCAIEGCSSPCTLGHLLNHCSKSLDPFKFRHDSVLNHILKNVCEVQSHEMDVYADLNGWRTNGGTVPANFIYLFIYCTTLSSIAVVATLLQL